ncbi:uncharacterized protein LOC113342239 [Papaver somniferum]|uniref:uncharacterized protein LOC113342239 n=1 Tax=Papaver somniferum TaxID=3469 RepID=UPI000E6FECB1|nr:uncharacterized protein LOC113342239 [Papaver somniferum]
MGGVDYSVWKTDYKGDFSASSAKELVRRRYPALEGTNMLWRPAVHPALAARNWKLLRGVCATLDKVRSRFKYQVVNKCCLCNNQEESLEHILWSYNFASRAWNWISNVFGLLPHENFITYYKAAKGRSRMIKDLWLLAILAIRSELWMTRNGLIYGNQRVNWLFFQKKVKNFVPKECFWEPLVHNELMLCCDGAERSNPGREGAGVVSGQFCIGTDSMSVVLVFSSNINAVPWFLRPRWVAVRAIYNAIRITHSHREANFAADYMAKRSFLLEEGEGLSYENRPDFILSIELPNVSYFRFD